MRRKFAHNKTLILVSVKFMGGATCIWPYLPRNSSRLVNGRRGNLNERNQKSPENLSGNGEILTIDLPIPSLQC